jgi:hypothetical protein
MKIKYISFLLLASTLRAQNPTTAPKLSTAETVAITALENQKQKATQDYQGAMQAENNIAAEFAVIHPGYHLNPTNFAVVKDTTVDTKNTPKKDK